VLVLLASACKPTPSADAPDAAPWGATSTRRAEALAECKLPEPPRACTTDRDCATFDLAIGSCGGCPETIALGVSAQEKDGFLAKWQCRRPPCEHERDAPCVVHWHHAESGPATPPPGAEIVVRCVRDRASTQRVCMTQYSD
jgi:hypothetical protein